MRRPLRIAAAGAGYFSQFQYLGWRNMAREGLVELVGLANRDRAKGQAVAARFGVPQVFGTVAELLDATRPDLLDIITSPPTHREFVRAAVERGVAAICQKPFGTDLASAVSLNQQLHEVFEEDKIFRMVEHLQSDQPIEVTPIKGNMLRRVLEDADAEILEWFGCCEYSDGGGWSHAV